MKKIPLKYLIFLILIAYLFLGCAQQDKVSSIENMERMETISLVNNITIDTDEYGKNTDEIQEFLSATPLGSEIYLEQKESAEWYLKIEKTFSVKKDEEKTEMLEPIYGDSILI